MRRGDVVMVAAACNYKKPRPAMVVQTDAFPDTHRSVVVCQVTAELYDAVYAQDGHGNNRGLAVTAVVLRYFF